MTGMAMPPDDQSERPSDIPRFRHKRPFLGSAQTRRRVLFGTTVAVAGVLVNVVIWYGIPAVLASTNGDVTVTQTTVPIPTGVLPTTLADGADSGRTVGPGGAPATGGTGAPPTSAPPTIPVPSTKVPRPSHPVPSQTRTQAPPPSSNPPPAPQPQYRTVEARHGQATFRYTPGQLDLTSVSVDDGYEPRAGRQSDTELIIQFARGRNRETINAWLDDSGNLQYQISRS